MKGYRKTSGIYIEVCDGTPVNDTYTEVALRPSLAHILSDTWNVTPMDPATCWRLKTAPELTADKDAEWQAMLDSPAGKAIKAIALVGIDKGTWTLAELRAKFRGL